MKTQCMKRFGTFFMCAALICACALSAFAHVKVQTSETTEGRAKSDSADTLQISVIGGKVVLKKTAPGDSIDLLLIEMQANITSISIVNPSGGENGFETIFGALDSRVIRIRTVLSEAGTYTFTVTKDGAAHSVFTLTIS